MKFVVTVFVVLYGVCVGMLALLRSMDLVHGLTTSEMLYGPAITLASAGILWAIAHAFFGRKKHDA